MRELLRVLWLCIEINQKRSNLTFQESDFENPFKHYYYVDATPRAMDVKIDGDWHTILIGGLGKGGTSYYALDITDASSTGDEETVAKNKSLWEFTDNNMGYTYGRPIISKTNAWDGKWVAILPSGYNNGTGDGQPKNGDGEGRIFFVDLKTGKKSMKFRQEKDRRQLRRGWHISEVMLKNTITN